MRTGFRGALIGLAVIACDRHTSVPPRRDASVASRAVPSSDRVPADPPQLVAMVHDRPDFGRALAAHPGLHAWIAARFRGEDNLPVDWSAREPRSGQPAEHDQPQHAGEHITLRIAAAETGLDAAVLTAYELINMQNGDEFARLWGRVVAHRIGREQFSVSMTKLEHRALAKVRDLVQTFALVPGERDDMLRSIIVAPADYAEFRSWLEQQRGYDPEAYWRTVYDSLGNGPPPGNLGAPSAPSP